MTRYSKGARCERELLTMLYGRGYSVVRSAGSGVNSISPDLIAVRKGKGLAFECKAWENTSISIDPEKFESLRLWRDNAMMETYMAWRMNGEGWYFIKLEEMKKTKKNYTVTKKTAISIGRKLESVASLIQPA